MWFGVKQTRTCECKGVYARMYVCVGVRVFVCPFASWLARMHAKYGLYANWAHFGAALTRILHFGCYVFCYIAGMALYMFACADAPWSVCVNLELLLRVDVCLNCSGGVLQMRSLDFAQVGLRFAFVAHLSRPRC